MSYKFSEQSRMKLSECHKDLQTLFNKVIEGYDCTILCGNRGKVEQNKAYEEGKSQLKFPLSKHNKYPSLAVDAAPYPIDWDNIEEFKKFVAYVKGVAKGLGIDIKCGADFSFKDYPHFEV
jgi:peptidoglycan LD-endopeptidase CwlK